MADKTPADLEREAKAARLAQALRANLRRRKAGGGEGKDTADDGER